MLRLQKPQNCTQYFRWNRTNHPPFLFSSFFLFFKMWVVQDDMKLEIVELKFEELRKLEYSPGKT